MTDTAESIATVVTRAPTRRAWRQPVLLPALLGALLLGLLTASAWLWWSGRQVIDQAPLAVARQVAQNFFTLDYRHAATDTGRVLDLSTEPFKSQYTAMRSTVQDGLTRKQLTLSATIPDDGTALEYEHGSKAQVLVAVDVTTKAPSGSSQVNRYRARIELKREHDRWLVSQFNQVG